MKFQFSTNNLAIHHWGLISIYRLLSHPFRTLDNYAVPMKTRFQLRNKQVPQIGIKWCNKIRSFKKTFIFCVLVKAKLFYNYSWPVCQSKGLVLFVYLNMLELFYRFQTWLSYSSDSYYKKVHVISEASLYHQILKM